MTIAGKILRTIGSIATYIISEPKAAASYASAYSRLRSELLDLSALFIDALKDGQLTIDEIERISEAIQGLLSANLVSNEEVSA